MKPNKFPEANTILGKNQPGLTRYPALLEQEDQSVPVTFSVKLSFVERVRLLFTKVVWVRVQTYGNPVNPTELSIKKSDFIL